HSAPPTRLLHSFPTRRSSDLGCDVGARAGVSGLTVDKGLTGPRQDARAEIGSIHIRQLLHIEITSEPTVLNTTLLKILEHTQHRSEEHTSELQSLRHLVCRLL